MKALRLFRTQGDIFAEAEKMMNKLTSEVFGPEKDSVGIGYPKLDIVDDGPYMVVEAGVPGLTKEDVNVSYYDGELIITGVSQNKKEEKIENRLYRELHRSSFSRSLKVDERVFDLDNITAEVNNGLLRVVIPRKNKILGETKKIEVK